MYLRSICITIINISKCRNKKVSLKKTSANLSIKDQKGKTVFGSVVIKTKKSAGVSIKRISYSSKNKKIATVSKTGKVKAKKAGSTKIVVNVKYKYQNKLNKKRFLFSVKIKDKRNAKIWKKLYTNYLKSIDENYFGSAALVKINNDSIPELYYRGKDYLSGAKLLWIENGKLKQKNLFQTFGYIEKSGKSYSLTMQMGSVLLMGYTLKNGSIKETKVASCSENTNYYVWKNKPVSEKIFWENEKKYIAKYTVPMFLSRNELYEQIKIF